MRMFGLQLRFFKTGATQRLMLTILETLRADPHRDTAGKVYIYGRWADPMSEKRRIFAGRRIRDAIHTIGLNRMFPRFVHPVLHPCVQHE